MCTVTWSADPDGYCVFFNRDEKLTRAVAEPPRIRDSRGVRFAAPIDADGGGTWIATNEFGLTVGLLNAYPAPGAATGAESRGKIPIEVAGSRSLEDLARRMSRMDLSRFSPFHLLALEPGRAAWLFGWSGSEIALDDQADRRMPLTSSSFESAAVAASRRAAFRNCIGERTAIPRTLLERFHASHDPAPSAHSVCMHRPDARTVSFSRVTVSRIADPRRLLAGLPLSGEATHNGALRAISTELSALDDELTLCRIQVLHDSSRQRSD